MLKILVSVVNCLRTTLYYGLYLSYKTGYLIVKSINITWQYFILFFENFRRFISVLCESLIIFLQDILQFVNQILAIVTTSLDTIYIGIVTVYLRILLIISDTVALISSIYNSIVNGITAIIFCIGQTFIVLKKLVILFGSGVWFLVTLVPLFVYYLFTLFISFVHGIYQELCNVCYSGLSSVTIAIKDIIQFILDVPVESAAGIIIALSLAYIFSQFYILIISYLKQKLRKFRNWLRRQHFVLIEIISFHYNTFSRQIVRQQRRVREAALHGRQYIQAQIPARRPVQQGVQAQIPAPPLVQARIPLRNRRRVQEKRENLRDDEKNCVICQERNKCILLLPCRHLCLCSECLRELRYYNEVCPICRTNIENTMKIFM